MGVQLIHRTRIQLIKMKSLLVFAVVVLAVNCEPEADPALLLAGYGYGYGYPLVYGHPYSLGLGCFNDAGESVPCAGRKRREAEAEADPAYLLAGYPYAYLHPYTAGSDVTTSPFCPSPVPPERRSVLLTPKPIPPCCTDMDILTHMYIPTLLDLDATMLPECLSPAENKMIWLSTLF